MGGAWVASHILYTFVNDGKSMSHEYGRALYALRWYMTQSRAESAIQVLYKDHQPCTLIWEWVMSRYYTYKLFNYWLHEAYYRSLAECSTCLMNRMSKFTRPIPNSDITGRGICHKSWNLLVIRLERLSDQFRKLRLQRQSLFDEGQTYPNDGVSVKDKPALCRKS